MRFDEIEGEIQEAAPAPRFDDIDGEVEDSDSAGDWLKRGANAVIRASTMPLGPLALAAPQFDVAPMEATSGAGSFARGAQQGASFGFADEEAGVRGAINNVMQGDASPEELVKRYVIARQAERGADKRAEELNGGAYFAGELAGGAAVPLPGGAAVAAAKNLSRVQKFGQAAKLGAAMGAAHGLGNSEGDLTEGEVGEAAVDTGIGAAAGALGGALGEGVNQVGGKVIGMVRDRAGRGINDAIAAETNVQEQLIQKAIQNALGKYRSGVQSASRDLEVLEREAAALPEGPLKQRIVEFLNSEAGLKVREQVAGNKLGTAPERIQEMENLLADFQSLQAGAGDNLAAQVGEALRNPFGKHVAPRVWTLGHRLLPPAIAAVGGYFGGTEGAVAGGAVGTAMSLSQGAPGRIIKNLLTKPATKKWFWEKMLSATGGKPETFARIAPAIEAAAEQGEQRLAATVYVLSQQFPEARDLWSKMRAVASSFGEGDEPRQDELAAR